MKQRDVFYKFPHWLQLICLFLIMFGGLLVCANMASVLVMLCVGAESMDQTLPLLFVQGASVVGGFLLPSLWFMRMQKAGNPDYLAVQNGVGLKVLGLAIVAYLLLCPSISAIQEWNAGWHFPERWQALEDYFRNKSLQAGKLSERMLLTESWGVFICTLLVVGVGAGLCEEFFFRGCLQNIFKGWFRNTHAAVWTCAAIFSLFHGDLFGFLPRLFLGAFLGYLYVWSGSIWTSVIVHTLNNSLLAFVYFLNHNGYITLSPESLETAPQWFIVLPSLLLCAGTCILMARDANAR